MARAFNLPVFLWGLGAVVLIMSSANFNGEIYDLNEDKFSAKLGKSPFYGGSQVIVDGLVSPEKVNLASCLIIIIAFAIGLLLQFYFKTGPWTIPLGLTGIITGFYYSKPPFRWVKRGIGELLIAYSYGWLPVAVGFYLQTGSINSHLCWISIPIACSIFNVVLINEFPDYDADIQADKRNLVVRLGKDKAALIYVLIAITGIITFLISLTKGLPLTGGLFYLPLGIISLTALFMVAAGRFKEKVWLERVCLLTLLVNVGTNLVYIAALIF
jgi:1,4-dihydroxy-2-naphthoate octaprenyltransferase